MGLLRSPCPADLALLASHLVPQFKRAAPVVPAAPAVQNLDYNLQECQGLVLAPTRELAQQIEKVCGPAHGPLACGSGPQLVECQHSFWLGRSAFGGGVGQARQLSAPHFLAGGRGGMGCAVGAPPSRNISSPLTAAAEPAAPWTAAGDARSGRLPPGQVPRLRGWHLRARGHPHPAGAARRGEGRDRCMGQLRAAARVTSRRPARARGFGARKLSQSS